MLVALNLLVVSQRSSLLARIRQSFEHDRVQVDRDIAKTLNDLDDIAGRDTFLECWVDDVPKFRSLSLIAPMLAEKPSDEDQILNVVLVVLVGEIGIKVAQSLPLETI